MWAWIVKIGGFLLKIPDMFKSIGKLFSSISQWWNNRKARKTKVAIDKAINKAIKEKKTKDLQDEIGRTLLTVAVVILAGFIISCNDPISIDSLCVFDLPLDNLPISKETIICWVDKDKGEGYTLGQLQDRFSIDEVDLRKISERLVECQKNEGQKSIGNLLIMRSLQN